MLTWAHISVLFDAHHMLVAIITLHGRAELSWGRTGRSAMTKTAAVVAKHLGVIVASMVTHIF